MEAPEHSSGSSQQRHGPSLAVASAPARRAVFLDRDGVINVRRSSHVGSWRDFVFLPGACSAIRQLGSLGWPIVVATNQASIGRGLLTESGLARIHTRLAASVRKAGGRIDLIAHCPHAPDDNCGCRKPRPGLFHTAAAQLNLRLSGSYFIGDAPGDLAAAQQLGMTFVLVRTGLGARALAENPALASQADWVAEDILEAGRWILKREGTPIVASRERLTG